MTPIFGQDSTEASTLGTDRSRARHALKERARVASSETPTENQENRDGDVYEEDNNGAKEESLWVPLLLRGREDFAVRVNS